MSNIDTIKDIFNRSNIDIIRSINRNIINENEILECLDFAINNKEFESSKHIYLGHYKDSKKYLENLKKMYNEIYEKLTDEEKLIIEIGE